jgi:hypothetical protein
VCNKKAIKRFSSLSHKFMAIMRTPCRFYIFLHTMSQVAALLLSLFLSLSILYCAAQYKKYRERKRFEFQCKTTFIKLHRLGGIRWCVYMLQKNRFNLHARHNNNANYINFDVNGRQ